MSRGTSRLGRRAAGAVLALACATTLAGCSGDEPEASGTDPVEVTVGEEFTWNDFTVEDGWQIKGIERSVDMEQVTTPEVSGTIVNNSAEERAALFSMVFSREGRPLATVNCSAARMIEDQSMSFVCPGLNNTAMPEDYDTVTVMEFERDGGGSGADESGT